MNHNYSFDAADKFTEMPIEQNKDTSQLRQSAELKRRETKYDRKIAASILRLKRCHQHMNFYEQMA